MTKSKLGKKGFVLLTLPRHRKKLGQELKRVSKLEAGTDVGRGAAYRLAPHGLLSLLSYSPQDHVLRSGTT